MENKYWFVLSPSIFIWNKGNECYLYDSDRFVGELFSVKDSELDLFIKRLQNVDNLYCVELKQAELENEYLEAFVSKLVLTGMARLVKQEDVKSYRPVQLPPLLNLQTEVGRLKDKKLTDMTVGEHVLNNLHEIYIMFPKSKNVIFIDSLLVLLDSLVGSFVSTIIMSGYSLELGGCERIWKQLELHFATKIIRIPLEDISKSMIESLDRLKILDLKVNVVVSSGYEDSALRETEIILDYFSIDHQWEFQVSNEKDYIYIENILATLNLDQVDIKPFYDGTNIAFFEKYVYVDESDIQGSNLTKRNIFTHQVLNTTDFGKLIITGEGNIYANIHHPPLGTLNDDIRELVCKEMNNGTSWRRIRDMKPCSNCVYQWLCPPPSDFEIILNKPNLCHVKQ